MPTKLEIQHDEMRKSCSVLLAEFSLLSMVQRMRNGGNLEEVGLNITEYEECLYAYTPILHG